jgi:hypothetical protein
VAQGANHGRGAQMIVAGPEPRHFGDFRGRGRNTPAGRTETMHFYEGARATVGRSRDGHLGRDALFIDLDAELLADLADERSRQGFPRLGFAAGQVEGVTTLGTDCQQPAVFDA